jgi:hypothetical protein
MLSINHGPFLTLYTYFQACAKCEHAATHALFTHDALAGAKYQALLVKMQAIIEHAIMLLIELIRHYERLRVKGQAPISAHQRSICQHNSRLPSHIHHRCPYH